MRANVEVAVAEDFHTRCAAGRSDVKLNQAAFAAILNSKDARVQTFQRGKQGKDEMEAALKKARKDFDPKNFGLRMN